MITRASTVVAGVVGAMVVAVAPAIADPTPTVTRISPTFGLVGSQTQLVGSGFTGATAVRFHGTAASFTVVDDRHVTAKVPAGATNGHVTVTTPAGTASSPWFVVQAPTTATITRSSRVARFPGAATISGVLLSGGKRVLHHAAWLQCTPAGTSNWQVLQAMKSTGTTGRVSWQVHPKANTAYRVWFRPTRYYARARTARTNVYVRPLVAMTAPAVAPTRTTVRVTGYVRPLVPGPVRLQRYRDGAWRTVSSTALSSTGRYTFPVQFAATGTVRYRVRRPEDATHLFGQSPAARVAVVNRTLSQGMSGTDVLALQRRLGALHYDVGAQNGYFGYDTTHAVVAFEKVQHMTRDGVVGLSVWTRLAAPTIPHLLHPLSGSAVEVDLTRQVLFYAVDGHIRRILDASTGGGYTYYGTDGSAHQAITPTGHWSVVYKVDHWVTAPLGTLYRPAYFNWGGYAIHGEGLVPSYPASHGCVRITVPAMDRLYAKLYTGLSVWIYAS